MMATMQVQAQVQRRTHPHRMIDCPRCGRRMQYGGRGLCSGCYCRARASGEFVPKKERDSPVFRFRTPDARARFICFVETLLAAPGSALERSVVYRRLYLNTSMLDYLMSQCETARILLWEGEGEIGLLEPDDARRRLHQVITETAEAQAS